MAKFFLTSADLRRPLEVLQGQNYVEPQMPIADWKAELESFKLKSLHKVVFKNVNGRNCNVTLV